MGVEAVVMPTGCCGMAGSFGFEADKYHWSRKIAEHALLPQLSAAPESLVLANGFSCREQIEQLSGRETKHIADLLAEAMGFSAKRCTATPTPTTGEALLLAAGVALAGGLVAMLASHAGGYRAAAPGASRSAAIAATKAMPAEISPQGSRPS